MHQPTHQRARLFLLLLLLLLHIANCVLSRELTQPSMPTTQKLHLPHQNMSIASSQHHHHHYLRQPCQAQSAIVDHAEDPADFERDAGSPTASACRREFLLDADCCDCGVLMGCRCSDPICDTVCKRVDESEMEEGMDDQGYRQHV